MTMVMGLEREKYKKSGFIESNRFVCDTWLALSALGLIMLGFIMVASASISISQQHFQQPFYFLLRQMGSLGLGVLTGAFVIRVELETWQKWSWLLLILAYVLLVLVLIPGIGKEVNGSARWLGLGPLSIQPSELAKLFVIIYLADYLARREKEIRTQLIGFFKPMFLVSVVGLLLLKEPDFGAAAVIIATALGMMFLAGVRFLPFLTLTGLVVAALSVLAISSPYRMARLTSFLNPWASQFDGGYQLTQSLIAFGRGSWLGVGLGGSVQKLFYLPEAHTDFVFAVLGEELGLLGVLCVIGLFVILVGRSLWIGRKFQLKEGNNFGAYLAYGLSLWIGFQGLINMGVNSGILPTKGLTLPFMSYGRSSMVVMCIVVAYLLRVDFERRLLGEGRLMKHRD